MTIERQGDTVTVRSGKGLKNTFYKYFESIAEELNNETFNNRAYSGVSTATVFAYPINKIDAESQISNPQILLNTDDFMPDNTDLIPYIRRHEVAELYIRGKPGWSLPLCNAVFMKLGISDRYEYHAHEYALREQFRMAAHDGMAEKLLKFSINIIKRYGGEDVDEKINQTERVYNKVINHISNKINNLSE